MPVRTSGRAPLAGMLLPEYRPFRRKLPKHAFLLQASPECGVISADPAAGAIFDADMQPGTAGLKHGKLRTRVQWLRELQRIALPVAFADRCFLSHDDTMMRGCMLGMHHEGRGRKEQKTEGGSSHQP